MSNLLHTNNLFESNPFDFSNENKSLFLKSFREVAEIHYNLSPEFKIFWTEKNLHPGDLRSEEDLARVPGMMVNLFKEWDLCSVKREDIVLRLTSSGTTGQKSQMLLNQGSLDRVKRSAFMIHRFLGMTTDKKTNYLCFTYDPRVAKDLGTAFTDELLTSFTGINSVYYAFQWSEERKEFVLDEKAVISTLEKFQKEKCSVRILGFPAFLYKLIKENHLKFNFGPESWVQTGGGWKGLANEEIPKNEFRRYVSENLGIPVANIRDLFGMVEHGIPYVDCAHGSLHIPNYSRVYVRSPQNLELLPEGETGLLHFLCSYNDAYPSMSVIATDWGRLGRCSCGLGGNTLEITGRAGVNKNKGCAIQALESVK